MVDAAALHDGRRFTAVDDPVGVLLVVAGVEALAVIIARDLDDIGTVLCIFPRHVVGAERWDAVARRVVRGDLGQQHPHCVRALGTRVGVVDLVADAPEQQAWVVAVAADPGSNILFLPLVKEAAVVVRVLAAAPAVEALDIHQNAHLIGQIHELRRGRCVTRADAVNPHGLEDFKLTLGGAVLKRRTETAEIVVDADALDQNALVIHQQPAVGCGFDGAAAKAGG